MTEKTLPIITPIKDGPLRVENLSTLEGVDGKIQTTHEMALCRCGQSKNKPFCDGRHVESGFIDERGENSDDKRLVFPGDPITFYENVAICSHAGFCPSGMPDKWREDGEFTEEELVEKVRKCPSGALSYARGKIEHRDHARPPKMSMVTDHSRAGTGKASPDQKGRLRTGHPHHHGRPAHPG